MTPFYTLIYYAQTCNTWKLLSDAVSFLLFLFPITPAIISLPSLLIHHDDDRTWLDCLRDLQSSGYYALSVPGTPGTPRHTVTPDIGYQDIVSCCSWIPYRPLPTMKLERVNSKFLNDTDCFVKIRYHFVNVILQ